MTALDRAWPDRVPNNLPYAVASQTDGCRFAVICSKASGAEIVFGTYRTRDQASSVCERLRRVGCVARVDGPEGALSA